MRIFLTGATGFIGSRVASQFAREGDEVVALVRPGADRGRLAEAGGAVRWIEGDLDVPDSYRAGVLEARPQACLHLAWYAVPGSYLHSPANLRCVAAGLELLKVLDAAECARVVVAGTCFEYDTRRGLLVEDGPIGPRTLYAAAKHALYLVSEQFQRLRGGSLAWGRIFYLYGPGEDGRRLVPSVIRKLLAGEPCRLTHGEQVRDFLHVEDVASALVAVARSDVDGPVNLGSGRPITVRDIALEIAGIVGRPDLLQFGALAAPPDDPPFVCAETTLLRARTGWRPSYAIREGLGRTIEWWRSTMQ